MLLKIITFNVAHGRGTDNKVDIERQANLIKEYKPDIIFLQELTNWFKADCLMKKRFTPQKEKQN